LDERGWLDESLEKISYTAEAPQNIVFGVLKILQTLEPCGIFARSLAECFALQLSDRPHDLELVERLLPHLDKISKEKPAILAKQCGMSLSALQHALQQLRGLNAAPLKTWEQSKAQENWRLSPDLFAVVSHEGQVEIFYNSENFPKAALDRQYYREIKPQIKTEIDKQFVANNYQEATHLVRAVEQREETLLKIARGIAVSQRQFFTHGAKALNPLTMAQLAEIVSLHESTVSRAVQGKTLLTPFGLQELKSFFSSSVSTQDGEEGCSSATVKHWIKKLLQEESPAFPLSDDNLVSKLQEMNIRIARRTIAKYREALQIPPSHLRKRANALVASA
jgi:RNA polymerase sigma-54 factor